MGGSATGLHMPIPVDAIPTLSGIPTEIQTAIVRYVFEDKHVRVIQKNDHIGVHEPKHGAIRLSCGEFYNKFSPLFEMESCAMFGNLQMNDKEFAEASDEQRQEWQEATHLEEWDRGYSYFSTRAVVYFLRSTEAGRRLAKLTAMDFRGIKWRGVFEILSAIGDVKHVTRLALDRGVHEHMTSATAQPAGSSIMKEVILDPNRTELQTRSWIDKHQNNAYLWSRLYERCGDDLDLRIGFRLSHWEHCQTRPGVSHELTGMFWMETNELELKIYGNEVISEGEEEQRCKCKDYYRDQRPRRPRTPLPFSELFGFSQN